MSKKTKGQILLDDFVLKVGASLKIIHDKGTITIEELEPAWEAKAKLEAYLSPQRDEKGKFVKSEAIHE